MKRAWLQIVNRTTFKSFSSTMMMMLLLMFDAENIFKRQKSGTRTKTNSIYPSWGCSVIIWSVLLFEKYQFRRDQFYRQKISENAPFIPEMQLSFQFRIFIVN